MERIDGDTANTAYVAIELSKGSWLVGACCRTVTSRAFTGCRAVILPGCYRGWRGFDILGPTAWFCALKQGTMGSGWPGSCSAMGSMSAF